MISLLVLLGLVTSCVSRASILGKKIWEGSQYSLKASVFTLWSEAPWLPSPPGSEILDDGSIMCECYCLRALPSFLLGWGSKHLTCVYRLNSLHCLHCLERGGELIIAQPGFVFFLSSLSFCIDKMKGRKKDWLKLNHFLTLTLWKKLLAALPGFSAVATTSQSNTGKNSPLLCHLH